MPGNRKSNPILGALGSLGKTLLGIVGVIAIFALIFIGGDMLMGAIM